MTLSLTGPYTRWVVIVVWFVAFLVLLPFGANVESKLEGAARVAGSQHMHVATLLKQEFNTPFHEPLILVVKNIHPARTVSDRELLGELLHKIERAVSGVRTFSYLDAGDPLFVGADGENAIALISIDYEGTERAAQVAEVRAAAEAAANYIRRISPDLILTWTGEPEFNAELREVSAQDSFTAEIRALPIILILLLIAFGSFVAGLLPVAFGFIAVSISVGILSFIADRMTLSIVTVNVTTMLGLALSIDYTLLLVSRFREEIARDVGPLEAARIAQARAGGAVLLSGAALAIALAALLVVPINEIQSIAFGGLVVIGVAVAIALTLTPAVLNIIGTKFVVLGPRRRAIAGVSEALWTRWAHMVFARPLLFLLIGLAPLLAMGWQSTRLDLSMPRGEWLPASAPSVVALGDLVDMKRSGLFNALQIVVTMRDEASAPDRIGAIEALSKQIATDPRIETVRSIASASSKAVPDQKSQSSFSDPTAIFLSRHGDKVLLLVVPREASEPHELSALVRELRAIGTPGPITEILIGGTPALHADYQDGVSAHATTVVFIIVTTTFLALVFGYRSLLLPLKAVALNLVSVAAALGALVLVFQDGVGASLLGLGAPYGGVFPIIPILVFAVVFGLSMDYEVFLFNRVSEAHRANATDRDAMAIALRSTAGVITSAALIMICVFGAFFLGEFLVIKMLGFTLAVAILIDAVVVRLILGPAIFALAGRWNWWPAVVRKSDCSNITKPTGHV